MMHILALYKLCEISGASAKQRYARMSPDEQSEFVARRKKNPEAVKLGYIKAATTRTGKNCGPTRRGLRLRRQSLGLPQKRFH